MAGFQTKSDLSLHCRRAASVALEIAHRLGLPLWDRQLAADAALFHHHPPEALDLFVLQRLICEQSVQGAPGPPRRTAPGQPYLRNLLEVLRTFHSCSNRITDQRLFTLAGIAGSSHLLVESLELARAGDDPRPRTLARLRAKAEEGLLRPAVVEALEDLPRTGEGQLLEAVSSLPVYAGIALKVLALAADANASSQQLESLISSDQVLAGRVIHAANSWAYSPKHAISTIRMAVSYIGTEQTRKIVTAASFRPLFSSANLRELWKHSLGMARLCEEVAGRCGRLSVEEAFLSGLVHDIGRLAIWKLPAETGAAYARLIEGGSDPLFAERFLFGFDHGEAGAEILRHWNFPERLVEAVRRHHQPGDSHLQLTSLLYLAESRCSPAEAAASEAYLENSMTVLGIGSDSLKAAGDEAGSLKLLAAVA